MDSSGHSTPNPAGNLSRDERPLPPLPTSDSNDGLLDDGPSRVAEFQGLPQIERSIGLDGHGRQYDNVEPWGRGGATASSSTLELRSAAVGLALPQSQTPASNDDLYVSGDPQTLFRTSSHERGSARSLRINDTAEDPMIRSRSPSQTLVQALQLPRPNPSRTPSNASDSDGSYRDSPLLSHTSPSQIRRRQRREPSSEPARTDFVVPRWQPDVEVTMCPICRTQFSFFVRKHHCRKCGRVVCNSCSPHRITIPYQYIVQPPVEGVPSTSSTRPALDGARAGSTNETGSLGGGERVRLCNPCVPDPNTAPPQTVQPRLPQRQHSYSRSASTATASYNNPGNYRTPEEVARLATNFHRRAREPSIFASRPATLSTSGRGTSYTDREDRGLRPDVDSRSRSSTQVGSSRGPINQFLSNPNQISSRTSPSATQQQYRSLIPRMDDGSSRPSPSGPRYAHRTRIPEEDECWICHRELPSRTLENFETLRAHHVEACIAAAMQGSPAPDPSMAPTQVPLATRASRGESSSSTSQAHAQASSSAIPAPVADTTEARTAAREQAHAAVVFGHSQPSSPGPARRTGVFPYQATEKDCVDDAECTICLEEFVIGVEMGRLECFCRFHLHCIRQWFVNHPGQCPVHQHGAGF